MTDKADIIIWGYSSKVCNGKKDIIKKFKLSKDIKELNFIVHDHDNFPYTFYINRKDIKYQISTEEKEKREVTNE